MLCHHEGSSSSDDWDLSFGLLQKQQGNPQNPWLYYMYWIPAVPQYGDTVVLFPVTTRGTASTAKQKETPLKRQKGQPLTWNATHNKSCLHLYCRFIIQSLSKNALRSENHNQRSLKSQNDVSQFVLIGWSTVMHRGSSIAWYATSATCAAGAAECRSQKLR